MSELLFDCTNCIAMCCSLYERIPVTDVDVQRLADYFGVTFDVAKRRYTKLVDDERVLRRKADPLLTTTCRFLNTETRLCGIYEGRPQACRDWPPKESSRCVYYDVLQFEREFQGTHDVVPTIQLTVYYPPEE